MTVILQNFVGGSLYSTLAAAGTVMTSLALESVPVITAPDTMTVVLDPDGIIGAPEIVVITDHAFGSSSATVVRAQEGTVAREHKSGMNWVHSLTAAWAESALDSPAQPLLLHVRDEKASATDGGTFTTGTWQVRDLNTVKTNEISGASLATNQITLPAGTYEVDARAPAFAVHAHQARLYDVTGSVALVYGSSGCTNNAANYSDSPSTIKGRFTLTTTSVLQIEHQCTVTKTGNGFGWANGFGNIQVFTDLMIRKVA